MKNTKKVQYLVLLEGDLKMLDATLYYDNIICVISRNSFWKENDKNLKRKRQKLLDRLKIM